MKREDLHKNRPIRSNRISTRFTSPSSTGKRYPLCHFLQFGITLILLLIILGSHYIFPEKASDQLQAFIKQELNVDISLSTENWNGSLKDLFSHHSKQ